MKAAPLLRAAAAVLAVGALAAVLLRTMLQQDAVKGADFWNHYWYVWHQAEVLKASGPTLFVHDMTSVFNPRFAFYGGTLYVLTAALGVVIGSVFTAYVATYFLAFFASYGGWWWLGRQAGLGRLAAHGPALVFVTAAYSVTLPVTRSAWGEYVAVSVLPLLVASGLSVLRADRLRAGPAAALAISVVAFTGSHNLTVLIGATFLLLVGVLAGAVIPQVRHLVTRAGLQRVAGLVVPAVLVNAWFLVPTAVYQSHTLMAHNVDLWAQWLHQFDYLLSAPRLYTLTRDPSDLIVVTWGAFALPVLAMAWAVAAALAGRPRSAQPWARMWLVLAAITALLIVAMTNPGMLIGPFRMLQFAERLESVVNLAIGGVVLATLVLLRDRPRPVRRVAAGALVAIVGVGVVQAVLQAGYRRDLTGNLDMIASPRFYVPQGRTHLEDYMPGDLPRVQAADLPQAFFPPDRLRDGAISIDVDAAAGSLLASNFAGVAQLARLEGAKVVGLDTLGRTILEVDGDVPPGPVRLTARGANPPAVVIGRWLTVLGLLGLAFQGAVLLRNRLRRPPEAAPDAEPTRSAQPAAVAGR